MVEEEDCFDTFTLGQEFSQLSWLLFLLLVTAASATVVVNVDLLRTVPAFLGAWWKVSLEDREVDVAVNELLLLLPLLIDR